jgi:putative oxidoreductase
MILRRIARPMLAAVFVSGGLDTLRNPKPRVETAAPVIDKAVDQVKDKVPPQVPTDPELLVKVNAAAQIGAGIALGLGRLPRLSALVLAASLAPTTLAGHRFWEQDDSADRAAQRIHFLKNVGLLGGLLIAAADTHGKPSLSWRAQHATGALLDSVQETVEDATNAAQDTAKSLKKKSAALLP